MTLFMRRRGRDDRDGEGDGGAERALASTRRSWFGRLGSALRSSDVTDDLWESLEEVLIGADTGVELAQLGVGELRGGCFGARRALVRGRRGWCVGAAGEQEREQEEGEKRCDSHVVPIRNPTH